MQSILVPTDGSPKASEAVNVGLSIAEAHDARVTFLHVLPATVWRCHGRSSPVRAVARRLPGADEDDALREAASAAELSAVAYRLELLSACTAEAIVSLAEAIDADLVVMGARHARWLHRAMWGSVTGSVLQHARRPVLLAHEPTPEQPLHGQCVRHALGGLT